MERRTMKVHALLLSEDEINDLRELLAELDYNSMKDSIKSINEKVNYFFE